MIDGLEPYPEYKKSGLPWVGKLPAHWSSERAKWLFTKMDRPVRPGDEVVTCFRDGMVTLRKNRRLRGFTEAIYELGYQGIRKGDLVIHAMDAFAGAIGVSDSDGKGTPVYAVCQPQPSANAHYYAAIVREMSRSLWILALSRGIRERSTDFRFEAFGNQRVPLPPLDEQAAIVRFLDHANAKIERAVRAKRKLIALLNEQKQAIIHRAITRGLDHTARLKPSGFLWIGEIPQHWEVRRVKYLLRPVDHRSVTGDEVLLTMRKHHGLVPFAEHFTRPAQAATLKGFKIVEPGQIVVNRMQAGFGLIFASSLGGLVSPDYSVLESIGAASCEYLGELFRTTNVRAQFQRESKGLGTGQSGFMRLYDDRLSIVHVAYPPPQEQHAILTYLATAVQKENGAIERAEREIALLREYRTTLTADVVTGKLDTRDAAKGLPATDEPIQAEDGTDTLDPEETDE